MNCNNYYKYQSNNHFDYNNLSDSYCICNRVAEKNLNKTDGSIIAQSGVVLGTAVIGRVLGTVGYGMPEVDMFPNLVGIDQGFVAVLVAEN